ncbi:MAG: RNA ligase RtcB family protein [Cardiobacteriaceae bacterium]|nr:RNA ligase RtcB family protein [Cardiobacteriaceae bacterium]
MTNIQAISENISVIRNNDLWIEETAVDQLRYTAKLEGMLKVCGMPDLHPGRTYPVGAAFFTADKIYPALVGGDIGCGMALWQTELPRRSNLDKLEKNIGNIDKEISAADAEELLGYAAKTQANGTIGAGNHFAELVQVESIFQEAQAEELKINKDNLQLIVHSGSRGLGGAILQEHLSRFNYEPLNANSSDANEYLAKHKSAIEYAVENRLLIAKRILRNLKTSGELILDICHNFVEKTNIAGRDGFLHRKGAAASDRRLAIIPGSRGNFSYLVATKINETALNSIAHGAGRKWKRSDCEGRLAAKFTSEQLKRTKYKSRVICEDRDLLYEEAPQAYKDIETVIDALSEADIIQPIVRFSPVLTYKKRAN